MRGIQTQQKHVYCSMAAGERKPSLRERGSFGRVRSVSHRVPACVHRGLCGRSGGRRRAYFPACLPDFRHTGAYGNRHKQTQLRHGHRARHLPVCKKRLCPMEACGILCGVRADRLRLWRFLCCAEKRLQAIRKKNRFARGRPPRFRGRSRSSLARTMDFTGRVRARS